MDRKALRDRVHRYNEADPVGSASRKPPEAVAKLTTAQMAKLRELVLAGPDRKIHQFIRWRCADLRMNVTKRVSVTVREHTIGKWLRLGTVIPKRDVAAQEAFKKTSVIAGRKSSTAPPRRHRRRSGFRITPEADKKAR
jgi:hypothetical protein